MAAPRMEPVTSKSPLQPPEPSRVPPEYMDLLEVFSKVRAATLPPVLLSLCQALAHPVEGSIPSLALRD